VQRPILSTVSFPSPFEVLMPRSLALKPKGRKPLELGAKVRVEAVQLSPPGDAADLATLISGAGLRDFDRDGLQEHDTATKNMWRGACRADLKLEFELPEAVPLGAIEVWNYNVDWQTGTGVRKADVAVSADGTTWKTVLPGAEFAEAEGRPDYDDPIVLKLPAVTARKVRFENIQPWAADGKVGLSEVLFHQAPGPQPAPLRPEDGAKGITLGKTTLKWTAGSGAKEYRVSLGGAPDKLEAVGATSESTLAAPVTKPDQAYFWRVDAVQPDGKVVTGRVARFETSGLIGWWKLDETRGTKAEDATGHELTGNVVGRADWAPDQGRIGGAMDFNGKNTFINCGKRPEFDFREAMTVAAWIKVRNFDRTWQAIVTKGDNAWRLQRQKDTSMVTFTFNTGSAARGAEHGLVSLVSKRKVDDGQWHHVVGATDGHRAALYVDGALEDSADAKPIAQNDAPMMIGCMSTARDRKFDGWIDDVRLYAYGLSEAEVQALYRAAADTSRAAK
jgi:hypothetical protein